MNLKSFIAVVSLVIFTLSSLSANQNFSTRPNQENGPTKVNIAVYVIDIETIDNLRQHFICDFMVLVRWKDERLKGEKRTVDLEDIWWPNTDILNGRDLSKLLPKRAEIDSEGNVLYRQRYYGNLACPLNLKEFPFDKQELPITIISYGNTPKNIELIFDHNGSGSVEGFSNADWSIEKGFGSVDVFKAYSSGQSRVEYQLPIAIFQFKAKRHVFYYIWKVIIPLLVIVMMSWAIFYIEPDQVAPQLGLAATSILTLIAFLFSLGKILPPIAYLTKIDFFVYTSLGLVFLAFAEAVITINLSGSGNFERAKRIDRFSRWLFPMLFLLILVIFYYS